MPSLDRLALAAPARAALARALAGDQRVALVLAGHLHRAIQGRLGAHPVFVAPSTYLQARLDFEATELSFTAEPPGFAVHVLDGPQVVSHVVSA